MGSGWLRCIYICMYANLAKELGLRERRRRDEHGGLEARLGWKRGRPDEEGRSRVGMTGPAMLGCFKRGI